MELKILRIPSTEPEGVKTAYSNPYIISFNDDVLELQVTAKFKGRLVTENISIDLSDCKDKAIEIILRETDLPYELVSYPIFDYVDRNTNLQKYKIAGDKIARVVVDSLYHTVFLHLLLPTDPIEGFQNEVVSKEDSSTGLLMERCDWFRNKVVAVKNKANMLNVVDPYSSLAYLEAQVDLLTKLVIKLITGGGDEECFKQCVEALRVADEYSVLNIKNFASVKKEFTQGKATLRKLQGEYYERLKKR